MLAKPAPPSNRQRVVLRITRRAWRYLALGAQKLGWAAHGMAGFDRARAREATGLPEADFNIGAAIAIGRPTDKSVLPEAFQAREVPSGRGPVSGFVFEGQYRVS